MDEASSPSKSSPRSMLSERQWQSLRLVAKGLTSKEIGRELGLSPSTVDNHIRAAIDRLGAKSRHEAARTAVPDGLVWPNMVEAATDGIKWWELPPLAGRSNNLTIGQRIYRILQVAILAVVAVSAAILTIAGVVNILSP